jgi:uncharacterized protein (DUF924 family)
MSAGIIDEIVAFWFETLKPEDWYRKNPAIDAKITERFGATYDALKTGVPPEWLAEPKGMLAAILVLDQFPRNMFRDTPAMFASDARALEYAFDAIDRENDKQLATEERTFLYMPLMHSEKLSVQERCVDLFASFRDSLSGPARDAVGRNLEFALRHRDIIRRFARFPHRNAILGRPSTPEEQAFLKEPGSSF